MTTRRVSHKKVSGIADNGNPAQVQPSDYNNDHDVVLETTLELLALLTAAPDKLPYFVDANTAGLATLTAFARTMLATSNAGALLAAIAALPLAGGTLTGNLTLANDPVNALHAATKQYVDNLAAGYKPKGSVRAASTANVSIASAPSSIDSVTLSTNDRVLLKNQTAPAENGIYVFNGAASAMTRSTDFNLWSEIPGATCVVEEGTTNADSGWVCTANQGGTLGTTAITFSQWFGTGLFQAASASLSTLAALASIANLTALAGLTGASGKVPQFTGVGAMSLLTLGAAANNLVQLDGSGKLPAVDGSQLLNMPGGALGQCRLSLSGGNIVLMPIRGNLLTVNGVACTVPDAGVSLAPTGLTPGTLYYIYATQSGGAINALEASTTGHSTDTSAGNHGVEIKTGSSSRSLVGMVRIITGPAFADSLTQRFVRSWFNRVKPTMAGSFSTLRTFTGTSFAEINTEIRSEFLIWPDEAVSYTFTGFLFHSAADYARVAIAFDGGGTTGGEGIALGASGSQGCAYAALTLSEGYHYVTLYGRVGTSGTGSVSAAADVAQLNGSVI